MSDGIGAIVGKKIAKVLNEQGFTILFVCEDGDSFEAYHMQDCCESVSVHDIIGDLQLLVGQEIIAASEEELSDYPEDVPKPEYTDSFTWTIHTFKTVKGQVIVRWLGESNGYYSESVYFGRTPTPI